jgi:hypothetical protein
MTLPSGTVTFLFTDVDGSTRLPHSLGAEGYAEALAEPRRVIREACAGGLRRNPQGNTWTLGHASATALRLSGNRLAYARQPMMVWQIAGFARQSD